MQLAKRSCTQSPWPFFVLHRLPQSRLVHIRRLSVSALSSQTAEHSSDGNAESSCAPSTKDAAILSHAVTHSNAPLGKRGPRLKRIITTLDPRRLDPDCFMDISGIIQATVNISLPDQGCAGRYLFTYYGDRDRQGTRRHIHQPFPAGTHGFLYYHPDQKDPLRLQLRFRVTENSDLASFPHGHDLVYDKGYVWCLHVAATASEPSLKQPLLRRLLVHDGFIDETLILDSRNLDTSRRGRLRRSINTLDKPFVLDISAHHLQMVAYAAGRMHRILLTPPHTAYRDDRRVRLYDEGSALCRLERSTLPEHAGKRVIVMRLLKILDSPKLARNPHRIEDVTFPAEGELFARHGRVWCRDVDNDTRIARVLRLLYDADDGQDAGSRGGK